MMLTNNEIEQYTVIGKMLAFHCLRGSDNNKNFYKIFRALSNDEKKRLLMEIAYLRFTFIILKLNETMSDKLKLSYVEESMQDLICEKFYVNGTDDLNILLDKMYYYEEQINNNTFGKAIIKNSGIVMQKMDNEDILTSLVYFANIKELCELNIKMIFSQDISKLPKMYEESKIKTRNTRITYLVIFIFIVILAIYFFVS